MNKTYLLAITIIATSLILIGCGEKEEEVFGEGETGEAVNYVQLNCEQSGGTFTDGACACGEVLTYNTKSGFCANAEGAPGGALGEGLAS